MTLTIDELKELIAYIKISQTPSGSVPKQTNWGEITIGGDTIPSTISTTLKCNSCKQGC